MMAGRAGERTGLCVHEREFLPARGTPESSQLGLLRHTMLRVWVAASVPSSIVGGMGSDQTGIAAWFMRSFGPGKEICDAVDLCGTTKNM